MSLSGKPLVAGLTGSFGSGKTTVSRMFRECGAAVVDADQLAHEALEPQSSLFAALKNEFPDALAADEMSFSRPRLAAIIFADAVRRLRLEAMIHPFVFTRLEEEVARAGSRIVVLEVPLLFETGYDAKCDKTIYVEADAAVTAARMEARGFTAEDIRRRNEAQMKPEEKKQKADFTISNQGTIEQTREEVRRIYDALLSDITRSE